MIKFLRRRIYRAIPTCALWEPLDLVFQDYWRFRLWPNWIVTDERRMRHGLGL